MSDACDAIVVGSGPNGLARRSHWRARDVPFLFTKQNATIGGGARSAELTLPGFLHDVCSAVHPLAAGAPFFKTLPLERFALNGSSPKFRWRIRSMTVPPPVSAKTSMLRGNNCTKISGAYRRLMKPLARKLGKICRLSFLQPMLHVPRHPFVLARFGVPALCPARRLAKFMFKGEPARALFAGMAAHSFLPLEALASSAFALVLGLAGHAVGWPDPTRRIAADFRTRLRLICVSLAGTSK